MFRNKEVRRFAVVFCIITVLAAAAGFAIGTAAGVLALVLSAAFGAAFFAFTKARYQRLAHLADEIDLVLHDEDRLCLAESEEGELSILQSEITKMTLRIGEQNRALTREKAHLAESLADIAHQLRTPLTAANLVLSLLKKAPETERPALLRENEALFAQMDWLLTALLKLSRLDAGIAAFQIERTAVQTLVRTAARPLAIALDLHDIALQVEIPPTAVLPCDPGWLTEALQNLLKNCMESTGDHGVIAIRCADNPLFTEITLHDSGPGFAKEDLPHLFDRFYRGKNAGATGYGIGLALCKSIVTRQGGTIMAKNDPHGGAVFSLHFPK